MTIADIDLYKVNPRRVANMGRPVRILALFLLAFLTMYSNGFPNGRVEYACTTMVPSHGVDAQTSPPPYNLHLASVNHTGVLGFRVTLMKEPGISDFKGFLIQARAPGGNTPQGTFVVTGPEAQLLSCTNPGDAVSHTSASMKSNVSVIWLPPKKTSTDIQFRVTVVQVRTIFWTNVLSDIIPLAGAGLQLTAPALSQLLLCVTILVYVVSTI